MNEQLNNHHLRQILSVNLQISEFLNAALPQRPLLLPYQATRKQKIWVALRVYQKCPLQTRHPAAAAELFIWVIIKEKKNMTIAQNTVGYEDVLLTNI